MRRRKTTPDTTANTLITLVGLVFLVGCATQPAYSIDDVHPHQLGDTSHCFKLRDEKVKREEDRGKSVCFDGPQQAAPPGMLCQNWGMILTCR